MKFLLEISYFLCDNKKECITTRENRDKGNNIDEF